MLGVPAVDILLNISCGLAILVIAFAMFSFGWVGGGDAKLAAATAAWLGWAAILDYGLAAAVFGGVLTLTILAARAAPFPLSLAASNGSRDCITRNRVSLMALRWRPPDDAISELAHLGGGRLDRRDWPRPTSQPINERERRPFSIESGADQSFDHILEVKATPSSFVTGCT